MSQPSLQIIELLIDGLQQDLSLLLASLKMMGPEGLSTLQLACIEKDVAAARVKIQRVQHRYGLT